MCIKHAMYIIHIQNIVDNSVHWLIINSGLGIDRTHNKIYFFFKLSDEKNNLLLKFYNNINGKMKMKNNDIYNIICQ